MNRVLKEVSAAWKAVVGFVAPAVVILGTAVQSSSDGGSHITSTEWWSAAIAAVLTSAGVYGVRNGKTPDPTTSTPQV